MRELTRRKPVLRNRNLNEPKDGGNVITVHGDLTIKDSSVEGTGKITGGYNTGLGGGVIVEDDHTYGLAGDVEFFFNGGTITGNHDNGTGADVAPGVYYPECSMSVSGSAAAEDAVYVGAGKLIQVTDKLADDAVIFVKSVATPAKGEYMAITGGLIGNGTTANFKSADPAYSMYTNADGEACLTVSPTVTFDSDGGSEAEAQTVDYNGKASQPIGIRKEGYNFRGWYQVINTDPLTLAENQFNFSSPITEDITLKAKWTSVTEPYFAETHRVNLSSQIELQFKLVLPEDFDTEDVYVEFNVSSGRASSMNIANAEKIDDLNAYWFSCPLNALELNDTVTATYRYDADRTITQSYTVLQYIEKAKAELPGTANLLNALQNFGHYIQESGWTDGRAHAPIDAASAISSVAAVRGAVQNSAVAKSIDDTGIQDAKFTLTWNEKTNISAFFKPASGVGITSFVSGTQTIGSDTYYRVDSGRIGPKSLGTAYQFSVTTSTGQTAVITASAMSYVYAAVKEGSTFGQAEQNAMAAYYDYYQAALAY